MGQILKELELGLRSLLCMHFLQNRSDGVLNVKFGNQIRFETDIQNAVTCILVCAVSGKRT